MNIEKAKKEILRTLRAYRRKDEKGNLIIPLEKQRPVILMGPPGIGKTAIMNQIAEETQEGLVSYSMTHHTRQSAIGLPLIEKEITADGSEFSVTRYTMSEIVASIYEYMNRTGKKEGILFLDEINCVSETLSPVMLQLLQSKVFGTHHIPDGWVIVAAGNPPEYNRAVRDFDIATLDRVKVIDVEADLDTWLSYANKKGINRAVLSYLSFHPEHFYKVRDSLKEQYYVTARGWEDLSLMMDFLEYENEKTELDLIVQYLGDKTVSESFYDYLKLYERYGLPFEGRGSLIENAKEKNLSEDDWIRVSELLAAAAVSKKRRASTLENQWVSLEAELEREKEKDIMLLSSDEEASIALQYYLNDTKDL